MFLACLTNWRMEPFVTIPSVPCEVWTAFPGTRTIGCRLSDISCRHFLGKRTAVHQASLGCPYRCNFCGVVIAFSGKPRKDGVTGANGEHAARLLRWRPTALMRCSFMTTIFFCAKSIRANLPIAWRR